MPRSFNFVQLGHLLGCLIIDYFALSEAVLALTELILMHLGQLSIRGIATALQILTNHDG